MTVRNIKISEMMALLEEMASKGTKYIDLTLQPSDGKGGDIIRVMPSIIPTDYDNNLKIQTEI